MSLYGASDNPKIQKSPLGYNIKEVDALLADLHLEIRNYETELRSLRTKLDAYERRNAEMERLEAEAVRNLQNSKELAEKTADTAEKAAADILKKAEHEAADALNSARLRADETVAEAERKSRETLGNARQNASMILAAADKRGREIIFAANGEKQKIEEKCSALLAEAARFEEKMRFLASDTLESLERLNKSAAGELAELKSGGAKKKAGAAFADSGKKYLAQKTSCGDVGQDGPSVYETSPVRETSPIRETSAAPSEFSASENEDKSEADRRDYSFAGGMLYKDQSEAPAAKRKLYDTLTVSYDKEEADDGYESIKRLMESSSQKSVKNPLDFLK